MNENEAQELKYLRREVKALNVELAELTATARRPAQEQAADITERLTSLMASYEGLETAHEQLKERFSKVDLYREKLDFIGVLLHSREQRKHEEVEDALLSENEHLKKRLTKVETERHDLKVERREILNDLKIVLCEKDAIEHERDKLLEATASQKTVSRQQLP